MARSSGRSSSSRSAPAPARRAPPPPAAAPRPPAPAPSAASHAPAPQSGGMLAGLGSTMASGFAFGTGSALARTAVDSMFGGHGSSAPAQAPAPAVESSSSMMRSDPSIAPACRMDYQAFNDCLKANTGNSGACEFYFNSLKACQQSNI